jgi:hypothetical protein
MQNYICTFGLTIGVNTSVMHKRVSNQHKQYGGTVHLFIGTGRILCEITFIPFITDYNHDTNYYGPICLFIFKSVQPFVSRRVVMLKFPGR